MPIDRATGHPDFGSAGVNKYIVALYYAGFLEQFYAKTCLSMITNSDYNDQITERGDKVHIRQYARPTIQDAVKGGKITYENLEKPSIALTIDHAKQFAVQIDKIDKHQMDVDAMSQWEESGAEEMKIHVERHVFSAVPDQAHASNVGLTAGVKSGRYNLGTTGSPVTLTSENIVRYLTYCAGVLNEQNVPKGPANRFIVLPSWACVELLNSDIKNASLTGDSTSPLRNDKLGVIADFTIYDSNNLYDVTDGSDTVTNILFGHKKAIGYARQLVDFDYFEKLEATWGSAIRALEVYGFKTLIDEALGVLYAKPAAL